MAHILLIEDDVSLRNVLADMLERNGYDVAVASDGEEGSRIYDETLPDLVITDIIMPKKGGLLTIQYLKEKYPEVKIIAISGGGVLDAGQYLGISENLRADRSFEKPFSNKELLQAVKELIG